MNNSRLTGRSNTHGEITLTPNRRSSHSNPLLKITSFFNGFCGGAGKESDDEDDRFDSLVLPTAPVVDRRAAMLGTRAPRISGNDSYADSTDQVMNDTPSHPRHYDSNALPALPTATAVAIIETGSYPPYIHHDYTERQLPRRRMLRKQSSASNLVEIVKFEVIHASMYFRVFMGFILFLTFIISQGGIKEISHMIQESLHVSPTHANITSQAMEIPIIATAESAEMPSNQNQAQEL